MRRELGATLRARLLRRASRAPRNDRGGFGGRRCSPGRSRRVEGLFHEDGGDVLGALGAVVVFGAGFEFAAGLLQAEEHPHSAVSLAHHCLRVGFTRSDLRPRAIPLWAA